MLLRYLLLLFVSGTLIQGANILAVFPAVWKSHYLFGRTILSQLVRRGHNVTILSAFTSLPHVNITEIQIPDVEKNFLDMGLSFDYDEIRDKSILQQFSKIIYAATSNVDVFMESEPVQSLLASKDTSFDLLVIDNFMSDALLGFAVYYNIPTVVLSPIGPNKWINEMVGNLHNSALHPNSFLPLMERMDFCQRLTNTLMSMFEKLTYNFLYLPFHEYLYQRYFGQLVQHPKLLPSLWDVVHNVSMVLVNSHPLAQYPRPYVPNMVEIGGAHLNRNMSKFSKAFYHFMDEAPEGVIYISFGANLKTDDLPKEKYDALIQATRSVHGRMRILLKHENFDMENQPQHTVTAPWLPQQEILAHPNLKVFISSVGLMSMIEAMEVGVPVLGIPIFPEQELNLKRLEKLGTAVRVSYDNFTVDNLVGAINELTKNPSYKKNAVRIAELFNDTHISPIDLAVNKIEYVLRTGGARHLRSIATTLGFIQLELVDVSLVILLGILMIIAVPSIIICVILRKNNSKRLLVDGMKNNEKTITNNVNGKNKKKKQH